MQLDNVGIASILSGNTHSSLYDINLLPKPRMKIVHNCLLQLDLKKSSLSVSGVVEIALIFLGVSQ
jgi:hypothetical protein